MAASDYSVLVITFLHQEDLQSSLVCNITTHFICISFSDENYRYPFKMKQFVDFKGNNRFLQYRFIKYINCFGTQEAGGHCVVQVYSAWNTCVKLTWNVPRATRSYFVDQLLTCGLTSIKCDVFSRYAKYLKSLEKSPSNEVAIMANIVTRDIRSNTGSNVSFIRQQTGLDPTLSSPREIKQALSDIKVEPNVSDQWRVCFLAKLLAERGEFHYQRDDSSANNITLLINSLCIN